MSLHSFEQSGPPCPPGTQFPGGNSPRSPWHSPHLAHVELEEPPLLLHVLGHLRCCWLGLDDPSQAGSLLLLLHLPPVEWDGGGLGTSLL